MTRWSSSTSWNRASSGRADRGRHEPPHGRDDVRGGGGADAYPSRHVGADRQGGGGPLCAWPTQASSYLTGCLGILDIRLAGSPRAAWARCPCALDPGGASGVPRPDRLGRIAPHRAGHAGDARRLTRAQGRGAILGTSCPVGSGRNQPSRRARPPTTTRAPSAVASLRTLRHSPRPSPTQARWTPSAVGAAIAAKPPGPPTTVPDGTSGDPSARRQAVCVARYGSPSTQARSVPSAVDSMPAWASPAMGTRDGDPQARPSAEVTRDARPSSDATSRKRSSTAPSTTPVTFGQNGSSWSRRWRSRRARQPPITRSPADPPSCRGRSPPCPTARRCRPHAPRSRHHSTPDRALGSL